MRRSMGFRTSSRHDDRHYSVSSFGNLREDNVGLGDV